MDELGKIPPFTRSVTGGILAVTLPVLLQVLSPYRIAFLPDKIANSFELWRLVTPFLYGGGGLNLIFSLIMMYRSLNDLEDGHFAMRLADMTWAFILIGLGIIGLNTPLETPFLFSPFMMAVTHLWAQTNSTRQVNLYGLINVPAPYFPFAMLGFDLLNGGPGAVLRSFTGMVAAHAYYYISVIWPSSGGSPPPALLRSLLAPPQLLINLLGNGPAVPSSFAAPSSTGGRSWTSGFGSGSGGGSRSGGGRTVGTPGGGSATATGSGAGAGTARTTGVAAGGAAARAAEERQAQHRWGRGQRLGTD
ncbi:hypothetical protein JCM10908_005928 [Rhodotorula pacifica]|uniref:uncharacterized protein n=1 Tax=Rhodotorula pacifica TaxID=1495444 RepID=UPI00317868CA